MPLLMLVVFASTLFASALLLFLIEPMIGKMILPMLGGSPAVWNTCMVFFQAMLLAGYGYAHATAGRLGARKQAAVHAAVLFVPVGVMLVLIALVGLPVGVSKSWAPPGEQNPVLWVLLILFVAVGLPFFVVSASAPLLQRWFAQTGHPSAKDPYFLYAASNLGSMIALFGYPTLVEPFAPLAWQSWMWMAGYVVLLALTLGCAYLLWRSPAPAPEPARAKEFARATAGDASTSIQAAAHSSTAVKETKVQRRARRRQEQAAAAPPPPDAGLSAERPGVWRRLHWVALAFVPSSLMLGATTYITTDIAAIPLLWVLPLALYLLSFILVFSRLPEWVRLVNVLALPLVVLLLIFTMISGVKPGSMPVTILLHLLTLFVVAMVCHGELARNRPATRYLTEFYLWMSVGGVLGGLFNALAAPVVFNSIVEYQLAMVLACLLMPPLGNPSEEGLTPRAAYFDMGLAVALGVATLILLGVAVARKSGRGWTSATILRLAGAALVVVVIGAAMLARAYFQKGPRQRLAALFDLGLPALLGLLVVGLLWCFPNDADFQKLTAWVNNRLSDLNFRAALKVDQVRGIIVFGLPALLCYLFVERPLRFGLGVGALLLVSGLVGVVEPGRLLRDRSFFGVLTVSRHTEEDLAGNELVYHTLTHGTTTHGMQQREPAEQRRRALTYYHQTGPVGQIFAAYPEVAKNYAVIGLGTGTMAAYCDKGDKVTFYEIDPHVRAIANNPDYFTYLTDCRERGGELEIRMGDARLQIEQEDDPQYRLVVVDAFSSDAIPVHLINKEGVEAIFSKTAEDGIVAYHISNRHLDLEPVLARIAEHLGLTARLMSDGNDSQEEKYASTWVVLARKPAYLRRLTDPDIEGQAEWLAEQMVKWPGAAQELDDEMVASLLKGRSPWRELKPTMEDGRDPGLWTDDYSNVLSVFMWK